MSNVPSQLQLVEQVSGSSYASSILSTDTIREASRKAPGINQYLERTERQADFVIQVQEFLTDEEFQSHQVVIDKRYKKADRSITNYLDIVDKDPAAASTAPAPPLGRRPRATATHPAPPAKPPAADDDQPWPPPPPPPLLQRPHPLEYPTTVSLGLCNIGNNCYQNAVLQALFNLPELLRSMIRSEHWSTSCLVTKQENFCTACQFEALCRHVHSQQDTPYINPDNFLSGFIECAAKDVFTKNTQEDAHEFLGILMNRLQEAFKVVHPETYRSEYPYELFQGTRDSVIACTKCNFSESSVTATFEGIQLELKQRVLIDYKALRQKFVVDPPDECLENCLDRFLGPEALHAYTCRNEDCQRTGVSQKTFSLSTVPPILVFQLSRFFNDSKGNPVKIQGHVAFTFDFDLEPFLPGPQQAPYKLTAVVVHKGESFVGHYYSYVRDPNRDQWWKMNDSLVSPVTHQEVLEAEAYMLFYQKSQAHPSEAETPKHSNMTSTKDGLGTSSRIYMDSSQGGLEYSGEKRKAEDGTDSRVNPKRHGRSSSG